MESHYVAQASLKLIILFKSVGVTFVYYHTLLGPVSLLRTHTYFMIIMDLFVLSEVVSQEAWVSAWVGCVALLLSSRDLGLTSQFPSCKIGPASCEGLEQHPRGPQKERRK